MGSRTIAIIRGALLLAALVVILLVVGKYLQDNEAIPGKATPVQPSVNPSVAVSVTSTATPAGTPASASVDDAKDAKTPPAGYAQSCAASTPWGQQVSAPFVCFESPKPGSTNPSNLVVTGYAGGAFEHQIVVLFSVDKADGTRVPSTGEAKVGVTYTAPDVGMPGKWVLTMGLGGMAPGTLHLTAAIESPKDGSRVTEAKLDLKLE